MLFSKEEQIKLELFQFIKKVYKKYKNIYSINISLYPTKIYKKGKLIEEKCAYKLYLIIKYNHYFFYISENNHQKINVFNNYQKNNIYLKFNGLKLNYELIYEYFMNKSPLNKINIDFLKKEQKEFFFTKNKLTNQIKKYEGLTLNLKKRYKFYHGSLKEKNSSLKIHKI